MVHARLVLVTVLVLGVSLVGSSAARGQISQQLTVAMTVDVQSLDPRKGFTSQNGSMLRHVHNNLIATDEKGALQPELAERWEFPDPQTIRLHVRRGVRFHNGDPLDADSIKFSIESRVRDPRFAVQGSTLAAIDRVDIVDAYTLDVKLKAPAARSVLRTLSYYYGQVISKRFAEASGDQFAQAVGTGPFREVEYRPGDRLVLERNADYWGKAPGVSRIVFRVIPEAGTRIAALERGEVDVAVNIPIDQVDRLRTGSTFVLSRPTVRIAFVGFKVDRKPLDDPRVRQALALAIDRAQINNFLMGGRGRLANTFFTPEVFGYTKKINSPAYDPARARQLLAEAGQSNLRLRFGISNGRFVNDRQMGEAIAAYFEQIGVRVELDAPEFGTFFREITKPDSKYDAYMISWGTNTLDADFTLSTVFHQNFSTINNYKNSEVSALIDQARATVDEEQARNLYERIQEILMRDLPWVPIVAVPDVIGVSRNVQGLHLRADELLFLWDVTKK